MASASSEKPAKPAAGAPGKRDDIRERIIKATIDCIERNGIEATGVRDIAQEAGVNGAAINYYFGSKDNLLAITLEGTLDQAFSDVLEDFDKFAQEGHGPRRILELIFDELIQHTLQYPRIAYAHMHEAINEQRYDGRAMSRLHDFVDGLVERIRAKKASRSEQQLRVSITQVWSVMLFAALLPRFFERTGELHMEQADVRKAFVLQMARTILPDEDEEPRRGRR
ncbi:TetR/AcrR family transcriptional regulator [Pendulispora rubella]|uniref:TetR/AcrR family transcriptional regulator n=1 Tax=Pendulispora rubella TaxID=2741070 RepID=UPI00374E1971